MRLLMRLLEPKAVAYAHRDLPGGIYDPAQARIEAESLKALDENQQDTDPAFRTRALIDRRGVVPDLVTARAPGRTPDRPCADCLDPPAAAGRTGPAVRGRVAFWLVALILSITMLGTTLPTPLYVIYQARWHFSAAIVTVTFAVYAAPDVVTETVPFDEIIPKVLEGKYEAGLIIHEGQLTFHREGLYRILDMGKWWHDETGLPLPLGGNAIRRSLGPELIDACCTALRDSIQYALDNREEALQYAMQFARDLDPQMADKFVGMYVNERTLDYGKDGREAISKLLEMGYERGIIPNKPNVEFVGDAAVTA